MAKASRATGHVGVVTYVAVNSLGNGTIHMLNENGAFPFDYLRISHWHKAGGYKYFDWLELNADAT